MSANRHPLVDTVRIQQEQIEQLGQVISVLISSSSIAPMKTHQSTTLGTMTTSLPVLASQISTSSLSMTEGSFNHWNGPHQQSGNHHGRGYSLLHFDTIQSTSDT